MTFVNPDVAKQLRSQLIDIPVRENVSMPKTKKPHWTQTPEGKAKLAARRTKKEAKEASRKYSPRQYRTKINDSSQTEKESFAVAYAFGRVESFIENLASRTGISESIITVGLAELLRHSQSGKVLGLNNSLPDMRKSAAK